MGDVLGVTSVACNFTGLTPVAGVVQGLKITETAQSRKNNESLTKEELMLSARLIKHSMWEHHLHPKE